MITGFMFYLLYILARLPSQRRHCFYFLQARHCMLFSEVDYVPWESLDLSDSFQ